MIRLWVGNAVPDGMGRVGLACTFGKGKELFRSGKMIEDGEVDEKRCLN